MSNVTTVHTDTSVVVRAYPWANGIALSENKRAFLEAGVQNTTTHPQVLIDMALSLASQIDAVAVLEIDDSSTRDYLHRFFCTEQVNDEEKMSPEEARSSLVNVTRSDKNGQQHLMFAAHVLARYQLLDIVADVLDIARHPSLALVPRAPTPDFGVVRITKVFSILKDWPTVVQNFRSMYIHKPQPVAAQAVSVVHGAMSREQQLFQFGMRSLTRAIEHQAAKKYDKVMYNIEVLVFCLWWFGAGFIDFPSDHAALLQIMNQRAKDLGIPTASFQVVADLAGELKHLTAVMRNTFHLAVHISPLVLLYPKKMDQDHIRKDYLIALSVAFGSQKPKRLRETENALWLLMMNMAVSTDHAEELSRFFQKLESIDLLEDEPVEADWFVKDMKPTTQLGLPVIPDLVGASSQFPEVPSESSNRPSASATSGVHESPALSTDLSADLPMANAPALNQETSADADQTHVPPAKRAALARAAANLKSMSGAGKTTKKSKRKSTVKPTSRKSQSKHVGGSKRAVQANIVPKKVVIKQLRAPDLPLPPPPIATEQPEDNIPYITPIDEDPAETTAEGVKLKLFFIDRDRDPLDYEFKVSENAATIEYHLLGCIQQSVERLYQNGRPLHHLDSARAVHSDLLDGRSAFFVTTEAEFQKLKGDQIQAIFRDRHIVIPGPPPDDFHFDHQGLAALGSLTASRQIQVGSLRMVEKPDNLLRLGTLKDLLAKDKQGKRRILNVLDLPMGGAPVPMPPQYRHLASNEQAWQEARDLPGMMSVNFPNDDTLWATAATQNATTWTHIDDHGMATIIKIMAGFKYWVILRPKFDRTDLGSNGDMGSINAFASDSGWTPEGPCDTLWDHEAVLLGPGDMLYMKPNTLHYVLTVEDSIVYGRHFYPSASMQAAAFGVVHTFVLSYAVTNTEHQGLDTMFRRMMAMWSDHYFRPSYLNVQVPNAHIPNISTMTGLMDVIAVGNLLELAQVLDRQFYTISGIHWQKQQEIAMARHRYRMLQSWFTANYLTFLGGQSISPINIFRRSLVEFAAAVIAYKQQRAARELDPEIQLGCTAEAVKGKVVSFFESNYPELLPCLHRLVKKGAVFLYWTGPKITIKRRSGQSRNPDLVDFRDQPIYLPDKSKATQDVIVLDPGEEDEQKDGDVEMGQRRQGHESTFKVSLDTQQPLSQTKTPDAEASKPSRSEGEDTVMEDLFQDENVESNGGHGGQGASDDEGDMKVEAGGQEDEKIGEQVDEGGEAGPSATKIFPAASPPRLRRSSRRTFEAVASEEPTANKRRRR